MHIIPSSTLSFSNDGMLFGVNVRITLECRMLPAQRQKGHIAMLSHLDPLTGRLLDSTKNRTVTRAGLSHTPGVLARQLGGGTAGNVPALSGQ